MAIGTTNLAATPCCGVIQRTWECVPDEASPTGHVHIPGAGEYGEYAPDFAKEQYQLSIGKCPDCGRFFLQWLLQNGGRETEGGWRWDYSAAERAYLAR
jgi:hypothetical protein